MGIKVKKALISAWDKDKVYNLAKALYENGTTIFASSGTAGFLEDKGIKVQDVSELTGFSSLLQGRVKTLHPKIFGGLLAKTDNQEHLEDLKSFEIPKFDLILVDLYPFEKAFNEGVDEEDLLEMIDIGGVSLLRAGAKNFKEVVPVPHVKFADEIIDELKAKGEIDDSTSRKLAAYTFNYTSYYDALIHKYLVTEENLAVDDYITLPLRKEKSLRYGENPHQNATLFKESGAGIGIPYTQQHLGTELSYNNIADLDIVWEALQEFEEPASVIVKHASPCGIAIGQNIFEAYKKALESDKLSSFGGLAGFNRNITPELANMLNEHFFEGIITTGFDEGVLDILTAKQRRRVLTYKPLNNNLPDKFKWINGGVLVQSSDPIGITDKEDFKVVTEKAPADEQLEQLKFAWRSIKYVKSNSILIAKDFATIGIGAGCPSRVDASINAVRKAQDMANGAVAASDAFMPFPDALQVLVNAGVKAVIQPGGSKNDQASIDLANKTGTPMIFTGVRHFRH